MTEYDTLEAGTAISQPAGMRRIFRVHLTTDGFKTIPNTMHEGLQSESAHTSDDYFFSRALDQYFASRGLEQKRLRQHLVSSVGQSPNLFAQIQIVLNRVATLRSQDAVIAAIDLLSLLGEQIVQITSRAAFEMKPMDGNAAFVLASAAGRIQKRIVKDVLLRSHHVEFREAAIEVIASLPRIEANPVLEAVAKNDESPALRHRAEELIEELA